MRRRLLRAISMGAAWALLASGPTLAAEYDWSGVDDRLQRSVEEITVADTPTSVGWPVPPPATVARFTTESAGGVSFRVATGGEVVYSKSFGAHSGDEVLPLASASKLPSVVAILTLVDDGLLSLATTVDQYFPEYAGTEKGTITLAQMLSHTTGLPATHVCMFDQATTTLDQCAREVLGSRQQFPPGTAFAYGGASFMIAGRIAEMITGQAYAELFEQRLAGPLGNASWSFGDTQNPRVPGGLESNLDDYDRFLAMIQAGGDFNGQRILSTAMIDAIRADRIDGLIIDKGRVSEFEGYGLGVWIEETNPDGTAAEISDPGAYGTWPWIDFVNGYRAVQFLDGPTFVGKENKVTLQADLEALVEAQLA